MYITVFKNQEYSIIHKKTNLINTEKNIKYLEMLVLIRNLTNKLRDETNVFFKFTKIFSREH